MLYTATLAATGAHVAMFLLLLLLLRWISSNWAVKGCRVSLVCCAGGAVISVGLIRVLVLLCMTGSGAESYLALLRGMLWAPVVV